MSRSVTLPHPRLHEAKAEDRPIAFLISTTPCARNIRDTIGAPAYSYHFVVEALAPVLESFGVCHRIDHPESRLAFAARRAEADGFRPVHLAINPLQDVYLSPAMPNIVFPFWEFPEIPDRDFGDDTRQNWGRIARAASLVVTACRFTARAFAKAGIHVPVAVVPVPLPPEAFDIADWDGRYTWTLTCRHEVFAPAVVATEPAIAPTTQHPSSRTWRIVRRGFRRIAPWLNEETVGRLTRFKRALVDGLRQNPAKLGFVVARNGYRRHVRRWLSPEALEQISITKRKALALLGREPNAVPDPPLPSGELTLGGGLIYLTVFNVGDPRKNYRDILTAFLLAFRDRADATLVIKLVTNRLCEHHEAGLLRAAYQSLGISHRCRIVVITEFLSEEQMNELTRVATYYVNASHAEGACLPLMRALAAGRPAIAPNHTAMADYMDDGVGFVPRSHVEPTWWSHDPERRIETTRHRLVWSDLRDAFLASAEVADHAPHRYQTLAATARERMAALASQSAVGRALREALIAANLIDPQHERSELTRTG